MHTYPRFQEVSSKLLDCCQVASLWTQCILRALSTKGGDWVLFGETYLFCVCVTCCSPQQGHLCARFALGAALGHLANGLFRNWESQTHQTHFKLAYIDLALNHFEPSWLWIHTRKKHKSTPKEHQNSLRKFAIWGSQFSELWPWWMILQQSQIHFFIFYQSELSQVFHWLGPHPFKVQSLWVLAAIMSLDLEINMRSECTSWRPWNHCAILRPYEGICCVRR